MSILGTRAKSISEMPIDGIFVIYGPQGTGKTVLASTFPKTKEKPMLYLDFLEGGTGSISVSERDNIQVVEINDLIELDEVLTDVEKGETTNANGEVVPVNFSTIVFDSATQLEYLIKDGLMKADNKTKMNLNLWGQAKQTHDQLWNLCKYLHKKTGAMIVIICHQKEIQDEENPGNNKIIPSLMSSAAYQLCAKASFVWYTKIEQEVKVDPATNEVQTVQNYVTYIDGCQAYLTKTRKPQEMKIPLKVTNLTYKKFEKNILSKLK